MGIVSGPFPVYVLSADYGRPMITHPVRKLYLVQPWNSLYLIAPVVQLDIFPWLAVASLYKQDLSGQWTKYLYNTVPTSYQETSTILS